MEHTSETPENPIYGINAPDDLTQEVTQTIHIDHNLLISFPHSPSAHMNGILADELENQRVQAQKVLSLVPELLECGC